MRDIRITRAIPEDAEGINKVYYQTWLSTYPNKEFDITREDIEESFKDSFTIEGIKKSQLAISSTSENRLRLVAKDGDMIVGVARVERNSENNHIRTMYILPNYQGQGIGSQFWDEMKKFIDPQKDIILDVATYNQNAILFYSKLGFIDTGKRFTDEKLKMKNGANIPLMQMVIKSNKNGKDWVHYYDVTRSKTPKPLLVKALDFVKEKNKAIDIGAGALNETKYLLENGFDVTAIDKSPLMQEVAKTFDMKKLHVFTVSAEDFSFPIKEYDLVCAMFSLPFINPDHFESVFSKIKDSRKKGGVFCGQFFGVNDEWANDKTMTFHVEEQIHKLLSGLDVIYIREEEKDDKTAKGNMKHWHVFHIIAKK